MITSRREGNYKGVTNLNHGNKMAQNEQRCYDSEEMIVSLQFFNQISKMSYRIETILRHVIT